MSVDTAARIVTETRPGCPAVKHDTDYAYRTRGCRCPKARKAAADNKKRARLARRAIRAARSQRHTHTPPQPTPGMPFYDDPARGCAPGKIDPRAFYPEGEAATAIERYTADNVCGPCPVKDACRAAALTAGERFGVWGGLTSRQLAVAFARRQGADA